jgi:hypothetical protein
MKQDHVQDQVQVDKKPEPVSAANENLNLFLGKAEP